jgi:hypothetical protein
MWIFIGLVAVAFIILYKRSTEIITVNPLQGRRQAPMPGDEARDDDGEDEDAPAPNLSGFLGALKQAAEQAAAQANQTQASAQGRAAIIQMVRSNQLIEAIQLYRRLYGVDLQTAKRAIDKMMLER